MNIDLENILNEKGVTHTDLTKSEKVKLLARWTKSFAALVQVSRGDQPQDEVLRDREADQAYEAIVDDRFWILPDDDSDMPPYHCQAGRMPDLQELVSDTFTTCEELVVVAEDFSWSAVFVNHGALELVGRFFQRVTFPQGLPYPPQLFKCRVGIF